MLRYVDTTDVDDDDDSSSSGSAEAGARLSKAEVDPAYADDAAQNESGDEYEDEEDADADDEPSRPAASPIVEADIERDLAQVVGRHASSKPVGDADWRGAHLSVSVT